MSKAKVLDNDFDSFFADFDNAALKSQLKPSKASNASPSTKGTDSNISKGTIG